MKRTEDEIKALIKEGLEYKERSGGSIYALANERGIAKSTCEYFIA